MTEGRGRLLRAAASGLGAALLGLLLALWPPTARLFGSLEARLADLRLQSLPARNAPGDERLLIVDIDRRSIDKLGRFHSWPRLRLAQLVDTLSAGGAAAIVFDMLFDAGSDPAGDSLLVAAVRRSGRVVTGAGFSDADSATFLYAMRQAPAELERFAVSWQGDPRLPWAQARLEGALPGLQTAGAGLGFVNARPDPDGVIRRAPLLASFAGRVWPSLALAALPAAQGWTGLEVSAMAEGVELRERGGGGRILLPLDAHGNLVLRFRGPWQSLRTVSCFDVLEGRLPAGFLAGRVVLVGSSLAGLADLKPVPLQAAFPGVEIQATVLSNLLAGDPLREAGRSGLLLMLLAGALPSALAFAQRRIALGVILLGAVGALLWSASLLALGAKGLHLPVALPLLAGLAAGGGMLVQRLLGEERERRWLAGAFSRYVSQDLLAELLRHPESLRLGGQRRVISLLFCDIRGFTKISEQLPPHELGGLLNRYLSEMSRVILDQGGTLDKYIGDAIVAMFGAPVEQPDHAARALRAALEMQRHLENLRADFAGTPFASLEIGIGVHCGPVLVGNFGSDLRFDYTAIGDAVNLASRLESLTKSYTSRILVTREILDAAGEGFSARLLDRVRVLGKQSPVEVHELEQDGAALAQQDLSFQAARRVYAGGDFDQAAALFRSHLALFPADGASRALLARCELLAGNPRPGWDGIWQMDRK
jgi:adenylate cyclase